MKIVSKKKLMLLMVVLLHTALKPAKRPSTSKRRSTGINAGALITAGTGALITTALVAKTADLLMKRSVRSINVPYSNGDTYLIQAARNNFPSVMKALLHYGAKVDAQNRDGNTALFWASKHHSVDAVGVLLKRGADVNRQNRDGKTALFWAVKNIFSKSDPADVIKLLLKNGADVDIKDNQARTIFQELEIPRWDLLSDVGYALVSNGAGTDENFEHLLPWWEAVWRFNNDIGTGVSVLVQAELDFKAKKTWNPSSGSRFNQSIKQGIVKKRQICAKQISDARDTLPLEMANLIAEFLVYTSRTKWTRSDVLEAIEMLESV